MTFDLLIQFYWADDRASLAIQPDVYLEFPCFLDELVDWMKHRHGMKTDRSCNAMTLIRTSTEIFCGAGVYTIAEVWHMAGLAPNLTEAEVLTRRLGLPACALHIFTSPSRPLVKCFLVNYVICVGNDDCLLYSDRLHLYAKDRCYVSSRFKELLTASKTFFDSQPSTPLWVRELSTAGPFDMFEPELVRYALESESMNLGHLIFGGDLWATLHASAQLPPACLSSNNSLTDFFTTATSLGWIKPLTRTFFNGNSRNSRALRAAHLPTSLYRVANTDVWSVIPAFPDSSAPIPRHKPSQLVNKKASKPLPPLVLKATPINLLPFATRGHALLSYVIQYTRTGLGQDM
ncbi:hypothetical protein B0H14DRAFT_3527311 [Mycena olivaceomarginata]|nr:hypothetical protein B0H14DRAFT_3527311 [Mycena olivaceomarginata]